MVPDNGVQFESPGGWKGQATGRDVLLLLALTALGALTYVQHTTQSTETRRLVCILSLPQGERPAAFKSGDPCGYLVGLTSWGPGPR